MKPELRHIMVPLLTLGKTDVCFFSPQRSDFAGVGGKNPDGGLAPHSQLDLMA